MKMLVYIVSVMEYINHLDEDNVQDLTGGDPSELNNADFIAEAKRQDNVLSLQAFEYAFNDCTIAPSDCFIRILPENIETSM